MTADLEPRRNADGVPVMTNGLPNPTGVGRYCAPRRCYCGRCPVWTPIPPPNYANAIRQLAEAERGSSGRKPRKDW